MAWNEWEIETMARRFGVSEEVVARRLLESHAMGTAEFYAHRDRFAGRRGKGGDGGDYYRNILARQGRPYVGLVMEAHSRKRISSMAASRYLGVKVNNLANLRDALGGRL